MKRLLCTLILISLCVLLFPADALSAGNGPLDVEGIDGIVDIEEDAEAQSKSSAESSGDDDVGALGIILGLIVWAGFIAAVVMIINKLRRRLKSGRQPQPISPPPGGGQYSPQPPAPPAGPYVASPAESAARFCDNCGAALPADGVFCEECGQKTQ